MSSLNATQADGYYIPPDYLNSGAYKNKSLNQFSKSKGHNQYLQSSVVRFEFPYDGFCENKSCGVHVGKGTRFNAHKKHVGDYFTTKIWEFTMKCRVCSDVTFVIRTNPKERCFDYCSGIKKKIEEFDTAKAGSLGVIDTDFGNSIHAFSNTKGIDAKCNNLSAIDILQKEKIGERKAMTERDAMETLLKLNDSTMLNDATSNSELRSNYRRMRKAKKRRLDDAKIKGLGMGIELSSSTTKDKLFARRAFDEKSRDLKSRKVEKERLYELRAGSIFHHSSSTQHSIRLKQNHQTFPLSIAGSKSIPSKNKKKTTTKIVITTNNGKTTEKADVKVKNEEEKKNDTLSNPQNELNHLIGFYDSDSSDSNER